MQSLMIRLGSNAQQLPQWLVSPADAPGSYRKIVEDINDIQIRRTQMSYVWKEIFASPGEGDEAAAVAAPEFFWDDEAHGAAKPAAQNTSNWKGLPVCAGKLAGLAVVMNSKTEIATLESLKKHYNAPLILVFRHARPQTVEYFGVASALVFCEGGVLSHACTVAREMNIPCITALGPDFFDFASSSEKLWLTLDGAAGTIGKNS
jgi:phosphohistidine swiveling domain-containing protein